MQGNISAELPELQRLAGQLAGHSRAIADRTKPEYFGANTSSSGISAIPTTPAGTRFLKALAAARAQHDAALQHLERYFDTAGLEISGLCTRLAEHDATHASTFARTLAAG